MQSNTTTFQGIPLNQLVLSCENVRKTKPTPSEQIELKASIQAHGLLENLIVCANPAGTYDVLAGGRRLAADHAVSCLIHDGSPNEISLAENVVRVSMSPIDQFEAFSELSSRGSTTPEIARRFGQTERDVEQRLRLGRVAPELRDAYREGQINLDVLMAFAITDDTAQQLAVWSELEHSYSHAGQVRRLLTDTRIVATSKYVRFIGVDAYTAAGGSITRDLFTDGDDALYLDDRSLVMDLVAVRLEEAAQTLQATEPWKWVEAVPDSPFDLLQQYDRVFPVKHEPTAEQSREIERLEQTLSALNDLDGDEWSAEQERDYDVAYARLDQVQDALYVYAPEDRVRAGCVITVAHDGTIVTHCGYVKPEDRQPEQKQAPGDGAETPSALSASLRSDLGDARLHVAQAHLAQDFGCAFDVMVFSLSHHMFGHGGHDAPLDIQCHKTLPHDFTARLGMAQLELPEGMDIGWLALKPDAGFKVMCEQLSGEDRQRLFAHCVAQGLKGSLGGGNALHDAIGQRLDIDVAAHWRPTADNFFRRVNKAHALDMASGVIGEDWVRSHRAEKKGVLADLLGDIFAGERRPGVTAEQAAQASRWLPAGMAFDPDGGSLVSGSSVSGSLVSGVGDTGVEDTGDGDDDPASPASSAYSPVDDENDAPDPDDEPVAVEPDDVDVKQASGVASADELPAAFCLPTAEQGDVA